MDDSRDTEESIEKETIEKLKPFKSCFVEKSIIGRSNVQIGKPLNIPPIVTEKFYQRKAKEDENGQELINKYIDKLQVTGPREKYGYPKTENQRYGWYQIQLTDLDRSDKRLNFHKHTNVIVKEHLMNYAKIRN